MCYNVTPVAYFIEKCFWTDLILATFQIKLPDRSTKFKFKPNMVV